MRNLQITQAITNRESRSVETYFTEIGKVDMISAEEEVTLAQKIKQGDQAALERLTKANLRFVVSVAKKYQHQGLPLSDLINEGNLGLIKAAKRFDETRGFKFISFAVWWIRQSIMAAITENARMIRIPMNKVNEISKISKALSAIEQETLREPTHQQIADYLQIDQNKVKEALYCAPWTKSYDAPLSEEDTYSHLEKFSSNTPEPDHRLMTESFNIEMAHLLANLSEREKKIIQLTYGFESGLEMSPADISKQTGMTPERVRKIKNEALQKLKDQSVKTSFEF